MAPNPNALLQQGHTLTDAGRHNEAIEVYQKFLKTVNTHPSRHGVSLRVGQLLMLAGRHAKSVAHFKKMVDRDGRDIDALYGLVQAQAFLAQLDEANATVDRILTLEPDHAEAIARRATFLNYLGRPEEGGAVLDEAAQRGIRHWSLELALAGLAPKLGRSEEAVDRLRAMLGEGDFDEKERSEMLINLGYLLDKLGRYDEAWEAVTEGNAPESAKWNADGFARHMDQLIETQTPEMLRGLPEPVDRASDVLFILGSPRSGTTLIEQIVGAHPDASSAGELTALHDAMDSIKQSQKGAFSVSRIRPADMIKASGVYLAELRARAGKSATRIDKSPPNWQVLGFASRMLPESRVIYADRDPRDTAISCYFRHFVSGHYFSRRLDWLGVYLAAKQRVMRHWERVLPEAAPGVQLTPAVYEEVVANPDEEARRLVEFAGLPWDDACLRFNEAKKIVPTLTADQAGKGVYKGSAQRWRRYEKYLGPLLEAMGDEAPID